MTNEDRRADDLRRVHLRETTPDQPVVPWWSVPGEEKSKWRRAARAEKDRGSKIRSRSGFTPASREQREATRGRGSILSGEGPCDPCHVTPRDQGGCDDELCTINLTRPEHRVFDNNHLAGEEKLDVLGAMIAHGLWDEMAHAIQVHHVDPLSLVRRLTGERHVPESLVLAARERVAELEAVLGLRGRAKR
jgi:hypothetical protein